MRISSLLVEEPCGQAQSNGLNRLLRLPAELLNNVVSLLANSDIKSLRLTCRAARGTIPLRFDRVFLSPHPRDIDVFRAVARHEELRHQITEIIYDDARIIEHPLPEEGYDDAYLYEAESPPPEGVPAWYKHLYTEIFDRMKRWDSAQGRDTMDVKRSWKSYRKIQQAQEHTVGTDADTKALVFGLPRFPRLKRVTLTPAAHGEDLRPLYETPMIRAMLGGLIYPNPRGWPGEMAADDGGGVYMPEMELWQGEDIKNQWRGFRVVTRALASHQRKQSPEANTVTEFVVDSNYLDTGLNCHIFTEQNEEYDNLVIFLRQPNVKRLDLSLHVGGPLFSSRGFFYSDALRRAYAQAPGLEHVSLCTNIEPDNIEVQWEPVTRVCWVPLRNIFPVDVWTNLRHFGLVNFIVIQSDLLAFLKALPPSLESVELSFLYFIKAIGEGSYCELLTDVRNDTELAWRQRTPGKKPRIIIRVQTNNGGSRTRFTCVSREVESFVYGDGKCPFDPGRDWVYVGHGRNYHAFDPDFMMPNLDSITLMKLGVIPWHNWTKKKMIEQGLPLTLDDTETRAVTNTLY